MRREWRSRAEEPNKLDIIMQGFFCRVTGFTSDFLGFIVVEHIRFFHEVLQLHPFTSYSRIFVMLLFDPAYSANASLISGITYRAESILALLLVMFALWKSLICLTTCDVFRNEFHTSVGNQCLQSIMSYDVHVFLGANVRARCAFLCPRPE